MPLMRRRPLLRAAAVGGGAYALGKHRTATQEESEPAAPATEAGAPTASGIPPAALEQLKQLGQLHEQGILTDDEFAQQKAKLLAGG